MPDAASLGAGKDFVSLLLSAGITDHLKEADVANGLIGRVAGELGVPAVIIRPVYYWLLIPAVRKIEEGLSDVALDAAIGRVQALVESRVGAATLGRLLPVLSRHIARIAEDRAQRRHDECALATHGIPNAGRLSADAIRSALARAERTIDAAFRDELREQLQRLRELAEVQPPLDLLIAPAPALNDPYRLAYTARLTHFRGREQELSTLRDFAMGDAGFIWWSVGGAGGTGKSRLALEAMLALGPTWEAGFLTRAGQDFAWHTWRPLYPTFVAVDYAAQRAAETARIIEMLAKRAADDELGWPVRLLLIDREAEPALGVHWSERLLATHARPTRFRDPLRLSGLPAEDLAAIAADIAGVDRAAEAVALQKGVDPEGRPLFACIAADSVRSATEGAAPADTLELLRGFLQRTSDQFWAPLGVSEAELDLTLLATMTGELPLADVADPVLAHLALPRPDRAMASRLIAMAGQHRSDPAVAPMVAPVQPSLAGEAFVLDRLKEARQLGQDPQPLIRAAWMLDPRVAAGFAMRVLEDLPTHPSALLPLEVPAMELDPEALDEWCGVLAIRSGTLAKAGNTSEANQWFERLLAAAVDTRLQRAFLHAARAGNVLVRTLGRSDIQAAGMVLARLLQALNTAQSTAAQHEYDIAKPLVERRWKGFAIARLIEGIGGVEIKRNAWAAAVSSALISFLEQSEGLPPLQKAQCAPLWRSLANVAEALIPETPDGQERSVGEVLMWNAVHLLKAAAHRIELEAHLGILSGLKLLKAAEDAADGQSWAQVAELASKAFDAFEEVNVPDQQAGSVLISVLCMLEGAAASDHAFTVKPLLARLVNCAEGSLTAELIDQKFADADDPQLLTALRTIAEAQRPRRASRHKPNRHS
ncbi:hypothetical protein [Teichococcus vastitatis]|uniref:ATP-binding protein n=1 Tax=Teichococcus vastitatis TaxID=2307076 RepID=A0ABS9W8X4_9PROT|nr:hypothetical protein [Pseudoroseomonas vastitatis]MCI0755736.1 hypothetical protein [Pseudoroseomonas vastitatis]